MSTALQIGAASVYAGIQLPPFIGDGMVLQRDTSAPLWGRATPGESISAELNGQTVSAVADEKGAWSLAFKGLAAGGPFKLTLKSGSDTVALSNVLVGDVWLCSGQSNMVFMMNDMGPLGKDDVAAANDPLLHWFAPKTYFVDDQFKGRTWTATTPTTIGGNSAVAYYFARSLRKKLNIPIGVLEVAFPGSPIEGWLSPEQIDRMGIGPESKALADEYNSLDAATPKFLADLAAWERGVQRADAGNDGFAKGWADAALDTSDWKPIANLGDWSPLGLTNGGAIWVRKTIDIAPQTAGTDLDLFVGYLRNDGKEFGDTLGTVYFNNQPIGTLGDVLKHVYTSPDETQVIIPGKLVTAGKNVIAIRFFTQKQKAPWRKTDFVLKAADKKKPLPTITPECVAKVEFELPPLPAALARRPLPPPSPPQVRLPSYFYELMLKPVVGYGIKGAIWYQGEANTESFGGAVPSVLGKYPPTAYATLLAGLISDWRTLWKQDDLPFYIVQLPNTRTHNIPTGQPEKSDWAALRESQLSTWQSVPHTGMVVTIDTSTGDLHSPTKKPVGERMALVALANSYGQAIEYSGPIYDSMTVEGNAIRLHFKHAASGLMAAGELKEIAIAGADQKFVWANAVIDGQTLLVSSPAVPAPAAVRYAWADNPTACHLYNGDDLPASPFRTDHWPLH